MNGEALKHPHGRRRKESDPSRIPTGTADEAPRQLVPRQKVPDRALGPVAENRSLPHCVPALDLGVALDGHAQSGQSLCQQIRSAYVGT